LNEKTRERPKQRTKSDRTMAADIKVKVLIIGDVGVGKTSLVHRFVEDSFAEEVAATTGSDAVRTKVFEVDGHNVDMLIRDTDGQERFGNITCSLYQGMQGIIVAYDIGNSSSFESVNNWLAEMERYAKNDVKVILVGNKTDGERQVSTQTGQALADNKNYPFVETSAKTGEGVEEMFTKLAQEVISRLRARPETPAGNNQNTLQLGDSSASNGKKKKPCILF
jgi:small GTP-binding protein